MPYNDYGHCPHCSASLTGELVWEHFFKEFQTKGSYLDKNGQYIQSGKLEVLSVEDAAIAADAAAKSYGCTRTHGRWQRSMIMDGRVWQCPDCHKQWTPGVPLQAIG